MNSPFHPLGAPRPGPQGQDPLIERLFPHSARGVEWGHDRMTAVLRVLGDPHLSSPTLHVGGTNGKGSVASTWARVLQEDGRRVGLYTSPHLVSFRERILVDGLPAEEEFLLDIAADLADLAEEANLSFFEATTLLAFCAFRESGVDVACIEVGLGGRLDATNVVRAEVTAITNVAMDHTEYLGETLLEIATEKAGIIKAGVPAITAESRPAVLEVLQMRADKVGTTLTRLDHWKDVRGLSLGSANTGFQIDTKTWGSLDLVTPLLGAHQATNAALAVRALELLHEELRPTRDAVEKGLGAVRWPGRVQIIEAGGIRWVFDVGHNTAGVRALTRALAHLALPRPLVLLVGILGDKDWPRMLPALVDMADSIVFTTPMTAPPGRSWDPHQAAEAVVDGTPIEVLPNLVEALARARILGSGGTVVVAGSCHTVGDVMSLEGIEPFGP